MDFNSLTDFPVIEMWSFGQDLRIFKQYGVPGFMLVFLYAEWDRRPVLRQRLCS